MRAGLHSGLDLTLLCIRAATLLLSRSRPSHSHIQVDPIKHQREAKKQFVDIPHDERDGLVKTRASPAD